MALVVVQAAVELVVAGPEAEQSEAGLVGRAWHDWRRLLKAGVICQGRLLAAIPVLPSDLLYQVALTAKVAVSGADHLLPG